MSGPKGIAPLIAEVLLIGFAVAVGGVVSVWLLGFSRSSTTLIGSQAEIQLVCSNGAISLSKLNFCNNFLSGRFENVGTIDLGNVSIQIAYSNSSPKYEICLSGTSAVNCTTSNLTIKPRNLLSFNLSSVSSGFSIVRIITNCTQVFDEVKSADVTTC